MKKEKNMDDYIKPKTKKNETKNALENDNLDYLGISPKNDHKPVQKNNSAIFGWILSFCILSSLLMIIVLVKLTAIETRLDNLQGNHQSSGTSSSSSPTDYTTTLNSIQSTVNAIQAKVNAPSLNSLSHTCFGTFSQNLSGSANQLGNLTYYSLSGSSPINLTCN